MDPRAVSHLIDMGATRPAALSALRACKGDLNEAAIVVFEPQHANATLDLQLSSPATLPDLKRTQHPNLDQHPSPRSSTETDEDDAVDLDSVIDSEDDSIHDEVDFFVDQDEVEEAGGDPFAQISFQKDRKVTVVEVEEQPEKVSLTINGSREEAYIMPQGEWMKGCAEGNEQSFLFQVYSRLSEDKCRCPAKKCTGIIERRKTDFFAIPSTFSLYLKHLEEVVQRTCPGCGRRICFACADEITSAGPSRKSEATGASPEALLHCPDLQAVILGAGLSLVQKLYSGLETAAEREVMPTSSNPRKKPKLHVGVPAEDDSGSDSDDLLKTTGVGYGGVSSGLDDQTGQEAAIKEQLRQDTELANLLSSIRTFMPNREREGAFRASDHMPSIATAIHIRRRFNPIASELLKNDSLCDMSERKVLYEEFLNWLSIMSSHENLCSIMGQPIMRMSSSRYLVAQNKSQSSMAEESSRREKETIYEGSAGPRELLENILRQVKAAKRAMKFAMLTNHPSVVGRTRNKFLEEGTQDVEKLESFCDQFENAVDLIDKSLRRHNNAHVIQEIKDIQKRNILSTASVADLPLDILKSLYIKWAESVRYEYFDFQIPVESTKVNGASAKASHQDGPAYRHANAKELQSIFSHPARNTAIAREHSTLSASLPVAWDSSVFLRVDESRPDVMRALITGPESTPYSNGCFIFDIFLPAGYNTRPPLLKSMTTKSGKYRLNPNLYANGKVCLSLLGTWSGPGWIAGKSTLLQVIVSIQAMILCEEPYVNEPGWAKCAGTPQSRAYNLNVRKMVVDDAILGSLRDPEPAFKEVIKTHFKLKAQVIKQQLATWVAEDDGQPLVADSPGGSVHEARVGVGNDDKMKKNVEEINELLDRLLAEDEP